MLTDRQISLRSRHSYKPICWFNKVRANPSHFANLWSIWLSVCQKKTLTWRETLSKEELLIQWRNAVEIGIEQRCYLVLYNATRKPLYGCITLFADAIGQHMQHFATLQMRLFISVPLSEAWWKVFVYRWTQQVIYRKKHYVPCFKCQFLTLFHLEQTYSFFIRDFENISNG